MAKLMITCSGCHTAHKCTQSKFPLMLLRRIVDPENAKKMLNVCIGFLCRKCSMKTQIREEIKKDPSLRNMGWREAVQFIQKSRTPKYQPTY